MKYLLTFVICVSIITFGKAQSNVIGTNAVSTQITLNAQQISVKQALDFVKAKFPNNDNVLQAVRNNPSKNIYVTPNIIITIIPHSDPVNRPNYLINLKKGLDEMGKTDKTYQSQIRAFNGYNVLLLNSTSPDGAEIFSIFAVTSSTNQIVTSTVIVKKENEAEAKLLVNSLISNFKFSL